MKCIGGVIANNKIEFLGEEFETAINHDALNCVDTALADLVGLKEYLSDSDYAEVLEFVKEKVNDNYEPCNDVYLIGFKQCKADEAWYVFYNLEEYYFPDPDAEYSAVIGDIYTQIVASKFWITAHHCSPCYPNQGDVDTDGINPTYMLPPDVVGDCGFDRRGDIKEIADATE